jgi:hypothetical protein
MKKYVGLLFIGLVIALVSCRKDKTPIVPKEEVKVECAETISFSADILTTIENKCYSCHSSGTLPQLDGYQSIRDEASEILKALKGVEAPLMPQGGPSLSESYIKQFECWIEQGREDN